VPSVEGRVDGGKETREENDHSSYSDRVGVLSVALPVSTGRTLEYSKTAAQSLKISLQSLQGPNPFREAAKGRAHALLTVTNQAFSSHRKQIADLAIKYRLPSMYEQTQYLEAGGLVSYSANEDDLFRCAAIMVDNVLKGTRPADLP